MRAAVFATTVVAGAGQLTNWENWGELMNEDKLKAPVLDDEFIASHNARNDVTWTAGRNEIFEGATLKDVKRRLGTLQAKGTAAVPLEHKAPEKFVDLPTDFDWRTDARAANCPSVKEVRDQSDCGSCWAFGSVEAMTDRVCIASNGTKTDHLSAEDVTSCDKLGDMGCNGGVPSTVYSYYQLSGIVTGGNYGDKSMCYSYQLAPCAHHTVSTKYPNCSSSTKTPKCERSCIDNGAKWLGDKKHGQGGYSVCQQGMNGKCADAMQQEIYTNGPITGMFFVHQSFVSYKSGVYSSKLVGDPMLGGHAIKIMGWGTEDGTPYWLVANSWNEDWGDAGFFKILRGSNEDQIENPVINGGPVAGMPATAQMELV